MSDFKYEGDEEPEECECSECHDSFEACAGYEYTPDQLCDSCAQALVPELRAKLARVEALLPQCCVSGTDHGDLVLAINRALKGSD